MNNKKGDFVWGGVLLIWIFILAVPFSRTIFLSGTELHPYAGGFLKFSILATMGDLLGVRILKGRWIIPKGLVFRAILWGVIGMAIALLFTVFSGGTAAAQTAGKLPFAGSKIAQAFFASTIMNVTFGPMMYIYHKFGDLIIDLRYEEKGGQRSLTDLVDKVDWHTMVGFSWLKTCPFVWIPCHTIVFLLPEQYRVLASAFLSIVLGILVAVSKKGGLRSEAE
ncbi:hypothetical protein [Aminipila luticellarii]|uniref:Mpv17 / PMP22 family protein n=1 Tax=Aminipila luticellarii TaxID=2507160 RepID=A0A410PWG5_9FIRM|nr:hypothetical protein [Aminipila luticellarii]QAT43282.1 hypothetical protein EQM06_08650 [Aminipila luticellarii]